ncbi:PH domain-containing protein [Candidatus Gottesmanbacteria bacterium]|nr:PH domain-containing protein [Candidatus Gottesmanbacteria bacterium]
MMTFFILGWYLITFSYIFINFLLWYFTVSIVTNERIIDIDFINLLNKKFAETRINRIEDVTMRTGGFIRAFFDFGDVLVQTAAKEVQFEFLAVPHPEKVVRTVNELMGKTEEGGE